MKKLLILACLSLGLAAGAYAQETRQGPANPDGSRLAKHLGVTESQLPAFQAVLQEYHDKRRALHEQFRAEQEALAEEERIALEGVLTVEQLAKLDDIKDKRRGHWRERQDDRKGKRGEDGSAGKSGKADTAE